MFPQITILSREEAQRVLRSPHGDSITHVISLSEPEQEPPEELALHNGRHLILQFHDVTNTKHGYVPPTKDQVESMIRFAHSIKLEHRLLCHCAAGISRSSAAALTVLASKLKPGPTSAHAALRQLTHVKSRHLIDPNALIINYADQLLGYQGSLFGAYENAFTRR